MVRIPKFIFQKMIEHARKEWPLECCGILGGREGTVQRAFELQNMEKSSTRYSISPHEQIRVFQEMGQESMEMVAVYHSHPHTLSFPSETDVKMSFSPELTSIIISLKEDDNPVMKAFQIDKEAIYLKEIEVVESMR